MNEIDTAINELAGEIVAHPATSRRFLRLTGPECAHAIEVYIMAYPSLRWTANTAVVMRASFLSWHCGRRMAIVELSKCKCGRNTGQYCRRKVCTCLHCNYHCE